MKKQNDAVLQFAAKDEGLEIDIIIENIPSGDTERTPVTLFLSNEDAEGLARAILAYRNTGEHLTDLLLEVVQAGAVFMSAFKARYGFDPVPQDDDKPDLEYECAAAEVRAVLGLFGQLAELTAGERSLIEWWDERQRRRLAL